MAFARSAGMLLAALALAACNSTERAAPAPAFPAVRVAAGSDLSRAFEELARLFEHDVHQQVELSFGSSGLLADQIREGAPFDLFASANAGFVDELVAAGSCDGGTRTHYARGHLVIWSQEGLVTPPSSIEELKDARFEHIAIANPAAAPHGKAAVEALWNAGIWPWVEARIVHGETVRRTYELAQRGSVEAAIVSLSLVIGTTGGAIVPVDGALHAPIDQALVACKGGKNFAGGVAFARFIHSVQGRALLRRYGFLLPGEAAPTAQAATAPR